MKINYKNQEVDINFVLSSVNNTNAMVIRLTKPVFNEENEKVADENVETIAISEGKFVTKDLNFLNNFKLLIENYLN